MLYQVKHFSSTFETFQNSLKMYSSTRLNKFLISFCMILSVVVCQTNVTELSTSVSASTSSVTTPASNTSTCEKHDNDCKACVAYSECYYCGTDEKCHFKDSKILTDDKCSMKEIHYLTCRVNYQYLAIGIGVLILVAFLIISIFCCYCCCKKKGGVKISKDDLKWARQKEERKQIALEKRQERAERTEEIRKKYGLVKDSNPYQRFDA